MTKKIINIQSMYITAKKYIDCANDCKLYKYPLQYTILKSLACEIYLKLIIVHKEQILIEDSHNLLSLSKRAGVYECYKKHLTEEKIMTSKEADECLENISNLFKKLRYVYERKISKASTGFLNCYCVYLDGICKHIVDNTNKKELEVIEENQYKERNYKKHKYQKHRS